MSYWRTCLLAGLMAFCCIALGQDEKKGGKETIEVQVEETFQPGSAIYVPVKPAFVVNYGGRGKLKYIKLEVSLRVKDTASSNAIRHHMPLIRDFLVSKFSSLKDLDVDTQQAKETVRLAALKGIQELLLEEDGKEGVVDLFFVNFVVQR